MITAQGLTKMYHDGTAALTGIDLRVAPGEMAFIVGESGAGKSTLLKLFMGVESATSGRLVVNEMDLGSPGVDVRVLRRGIGAVFQDFRLLRGHSAIHNVAVGLRVIGMRPSDIRQRAQAALTAVGLDARARSDVAQMSWGEQQRVAIARALAREPALILADEPTGNLDRDTAARMIDLFGAARAAGATVLIATHAVDLVDRYGGRVITLSRGRITGDTAPDGGVGQCG